MEHQLSACRGQCYDGASNINDNRYGLATQISTEEKCAIYVHCYGHALNLDVDEQPNSPNFVMKL